MKAKYFYVAGVVPVIGLLMVTYLMLPSLSVADGPIDFTLKDITGVDHSLADYRGKWVLVNYWATWCPPCLEEIPDLISFHEEHKDKDAIVLGVNFEEIDLQDLQQFVKNNFIVYPVLLHEPAVFDVLGSIIVLPTSYLISPLGEVVAKHEGPITVKSIEDLIKSQ